MYNYFIKLSLNYENKTESDNNISGTTTYYTENSSMAPSLLFYLYHSKNLATNGNLGYVTIKGGTIVGNVQQAISNAGTLKVGINGDGNINISDPVIMGETYGIVNTGTFKFYDGIIKGITDAISGSITEQELNSQIVDDTEIIDGKTYKVEYLE